MFIPKAVFVEQTLLGPHIEKHIDKTDYKNNIYFDYKQRNTNITHKVYLKIFFLLFFN